MNSAGGISAGYDLPALQAALHTRVVGRDLHYVGTTTSTNSAAMALAEDGTPDGSVVLAEIQTAGRGRRGRSWHSPRGSHIYCSIIVRPATDHSPWISWTPLASALASAEAINETTGLPVFLKWPNDILVAGKKLGGVLCEKAGGQSQNFVVIGIGLNVNCDPMDFPGDVENVATSMKIEYGGEVDRTAILAALLNRIEAVLDRLRSGGVVETHAAYVARSATLGEQVRVMLSETDYIEGLAESIGPDGCLRVRQSQVPSAERESTVIEVRSTDVVHLRKPTTTF